MAVKHKLGSVCRGACTEGENTDGGTCIELSARNQIPGTVAAITRNSDDQMGLREGAEVVAVIKSTDVMVAKR